jgi:hypothetical protein
MPSKQTRPFRSISILVPLNSPASQEKRQRNKKLYYLLRWLRYGLHRGQGNSYCRIEPQDAPATMPHGAYRLSAQLQSKMEDFLNSAPFTGFISRMQAETIAPAVYLVEHKTNGEDVAMPPIRISCHHPLPLTLPIPIGGTEIDLYHTPHFARQSLTAPLDMPVEEYPVD